MIYFKAIMFSISAAAFLSACDGAENRKITYLNKGNDYLEAGKFDKANIEFKNVLQIDPKSVDGHYQMARLNEKLKQFRKALSGYNKVVELKPDHKEALAHLGRIYLWANNDDKAMEYAEKSLSLDAQFADALVVRAGAYVRQSNISLALNDVQSVLHKTPDHLAGLSMLARIYLIQNQPDKAEALLLGAHQRKPESISLLGLLVQFYSDKKDYKNAIVQMEKLVLLDKENFSYRTSLAFFHDANNNQQQAESILRLAVADFPELIEAKKELIRYLVKERDLMFAQLELSHFLHEDKDNPELQLISAMLYIQSKDLDKAESIYREIARKFGGESLAANAQYELVRLLLSGNQRETAIKELATLLDANPKNVGGLKIRGMLALEDKDASTAISDFRQVLKEQPQSVDLLKLLADAYLMAGEFELAEQQLKLAVQLAPADFKARLSYAKVLHESKRYVDAIEQLSFLRKHDPKNINAISLLLKAYLIQGDYMQAIGLAKALEEQYPEKSLGYFYHGLALQVQQKYKQSMHQFERALQADPEAIEPLSSYVRAALAMKQPELAEAKLDAIISAQPDYAVAINLLGEVFIQQNKKQKAEMSFKQAVEKNPQWWMPYRNLASVQAMLNQPQQAIDTLQKGLEQAGSTGQLIFQLVRLLEHQGKISEAVAVYEKVLKQFPGSLDVANNLALLLVDHLVDQQSKDRAMSLVKQFQMSKNPSHLDTLGWVYYKRGEYEQALSALLQADELAPEQALIHYHLGHVYLGKGDKVAARKHLENVVSSRQEFSGKDEAKRLLAELSSPVNNA